MSSFRPIFWCQRKLTEFFALPKLTDIGAELSDRALLNGGGTERGVCDICVARACADARQTNDTNPFPQTTLFVVLKSRLITSSARHSLVTEKKRTPHLGPPPFKSA